jgi:DNA polymerase III subunit gamma/tau
MAYQTLYLKYRSQTFADLVGQNPIARTLSNAVEQDRVAHAYLFSGVRGTGKTSTARILARAINCLNRTGAEPCGVCAACVEISSGAAVDLVEIDAASNRGIDEIRDLRERVKYLPASLKVKVYIIDEAHMLTPEAFNALLKTLEEPPAHVLFVLATTEPHKIPLTVASRCQRFDFRRIETEGIAKRLADIVVREGVKVDPQSLALIARLAQGSMRDGITLLDQLISQGERDLTVERTRELLGLADPDTLVDILGAAAAGDAADVLGRLQRFYDAGGDVRQLVRGLLSAIREAALLSVGYREADGLGAGASARLEKIARAAGRRGLLALWKGLMEMEPELRKGADARLLLEVTLLQSMSEPVGSAATVQPDRSLGPARAGAAPPTLEVAAAVADERSADSSATVSEQAPEVRATAPVAGAELQFEALKQKLPRPVASLLMDARLAAVTNGTVRILFRYPTHLDVMQRPDKKELLLNAAREVFGEDARVDLAAEDRGTGPEASGTAVGGTGSAGSAGGRPAPRSLNDDPLVREAMNRFDAVNVRVTPNPPAKPTSSRKPE